MAPPRYDLEDRLIGFAVAVCRVTDRFPRTMLGRHVALQLIRSATSPSANYGEAQGAESRRDFVHKLRLSLKELREASTWLKFVTRMGLCPSQGVADARRECDELIAILSTSIRTALRGQNLQG